MHYRLKRFRLKTGLRRIGISILLLTFILMTFGEQGLIRYGKWLSPSNPTAVGDIVVALGDGSGARADAAFELLTSQRAKTFFTTSISLDLLHTIAFKHSANLSKIHWGGITKNTFDEALRFRQTMEQAGITYDRIILVSHPYHLRRSQWAFQQVLDPSVQVDTYALPEAIPSDPRWWNSIYSRNWVRDETKKLAFYWIYYGLLGQRKPLSPRDLAR